MCQKQLDSNWVKLLARTFFTRGCRFDRAITQLNVTALAVYNNNYVGTEIFSTRPLECRELLY